MDYRGIDLGKIKPLGITFDAGRRARESVELPRATHDGRFFFFFPSSHATDPFSPPGESTRRRTCARGGF